VTTGTVTLEHVIGRLVDSADLDTLGQHMSDVARVLGCDRVDLSWLHASEGWLQTIECHTWLLEGIRYSLADFPETRRVLETLQTAQVMLNTPNADPNELRWMKDQGVQSLLLVPVISAGSPLGLLECCKVREEPWSREQIRIGRTIASVLGPVLDILVRLDPRTSPLPRAHWNLVPTRAEPREAGDTREEDRCPAEERAS
jgi:GAF domain-containing protein